MRVVIEVLSGSREGQKQVFDGVDSITLGREPANSFSFPPDEDRSVSAWHAKLNIRRGGVTIEDIGSTNGTFVDGERIVSAVAVLPSQEVQLGKAGPRLRISTGVPQTIMERFPTIADEVRVPPVDATPSASSGTPARSAVGSATVLRMIDNALVSAQQSGRLPRVTMFAQEIVRRAVKESAKQLRMTVAAVLILVAAVFTVVFYRMATLRTELQSVRGDVAAGLKKSWDGVEAGIAANQKEIQKQREVYASAGADLKREIDQIVSSSGQQNAQIAAVSKELSESRVRLADAVKELERMKIARDTSAAVTVAATPTATREKQLTATIQSEQTKQAGIYQVLAQAAALASAHKDAAKPSPIPALGNQLMIADAAKAQMDARLDQLSTELSSISKGPDATTVANSVADGKTEAVLNEISRIERASAQQSVVATPVLASVALAPHPSTQHYTRPYLRASLKKRIALGKFECLVGDNPWNASRADVERQLRAQMTTLLRDSGNFMVVDREDLAEVLDEQKLSRTGTTTGQSASGAGQLLGAQALVIGKITQLDRQVEATKHKTNWGGLLNTIASAAGAVAPTTDFSTITNKLAADPTLGTLQTSSEKAVSTFTIHIDFKVLDAKTGEVLFTTQGHGVATSTSKGSSVGTAYMQGSNFMSGGDNVGDATRQALYDATIKMVEGMEKLPWRGRIMERLGDKIIINGGDDAAVKAGDTFQVLSRGKELIDPESGQSRGFIETPAGTVRVSSVAGVRSEAEIIDQTAAFKPGDSLQYLGVTRLLTAGESDGQAVDDPMPFKYALLSSTVAYSGPGLTYAPVELRDLEPGTPVKVKMALGDWVKVVLPSGAYGWLQRGSLSIKEDVPTRVKGVIASARKVRIHEFPSSRSRRVDVLPDQVVVPVREKLGGWYQVSTPKGATGWVNEREIRPDSSQTASAAKTAA